MLHTWLYSTYGYTPRVVIFYVWMYSTRSYIPRMDLLHMWIYFTRGSIRDVYVDTLASTGDYMHGNAWKNEVIIEWYRIITCVNIKGR